MERRINKVCAAYPCHDIDKLEDCTFCYCPLYPCDTGRGTWIENGILGEPTLDCSNCTWPHEKQRVDSIFLFLKGNMSK